MHRRLQQYFFFALFAIAAVLLFFILKPFLSPLFLAFAVAVIFRPLFRRILRSVGNRPSVAALTTVVIICLAVLVPLILIGTLLFNEVWNVYQHMTQAGGAATIIDTAIGNVQSYLREISPTITFSSQSYLNNFFAWIISHLDSFFSGFLHIGLQLFIMLLALFFILRDGGSIKKKYILFSPLADGDDEIIIKSVTTAIVSVVRGSLTVAVIQGILTGIGFFIFGIPNAILWGTVASICSLVPGIGTAITIVPGILYLFFSSKVPQAVGLLIWGGVAVGLIDNIIGPYLVRRGVRIHQFLILLSALGGVIFFGPIGFIVGPIILSVFHELIALYPKVADNTKS